MARKRLDKASGGLAMSIPSGTVVIAPPLELTLSLASTFNGVVVQELPTILLQAVVTIGDKTTEGSLIVAVCPAWFEIMRLLKEDPSAVMKIPPHKWEEIIAGSYERA